MIEVARGPYRVAGNVAKYNAGRTPADGEPDEVVPFAQWYQPNGDLITDMAEIERLEAENPLPEVLRG